MSHIKKGDVFVTTYKGKSEQCTAEDEGFFTDSLVPVVFSDGRREHMNVRHLTPLSEVPANPIPMLLWCPSCSRRHIDVGDFATKPHHTHACQHCGMVWRPAVVHTVGVDFLPGFKDSGIVMRNDGTSTARSATADDTTGDRVRNLMMSAAAQVDDSMRTTAQLKDAVDTALKGVPDPPHKTKCPCNHAGHYDLTKKCLEHDCYCVGHVSIEVDDVAAVPPQPLSRRLPHTIALGADGSPVACTLSSTEEAFATAVYNQLHVTDNDACAICRANRTSDP